MNRKTTPKVRNGKVQRKNRTDRSRHYWNYYQEKPFLDRVDPGPGYRHVLKKRDVERFLELLPDRDEIAKGLDAIVLARGDPRLLGWHRPGIVAVCAWDRGPLATEWTEWFVDQHRRELDRLGVERERRTKHAYLVHWTEEAIRGFQLMHVLLHELGHHHDRMTTRSRRRAGRGEPYAEYYARTYAHRIWDDYFRVFGY